MKQFKIYNATEIGNLPKKTWIVDGEIPDKGFAVIYGPPGTYKSFIALDLALHVAQSSPVVYVAAEGSSGYEDRKNAWCQLHRKGEHNLHFVFDAIKMLDLSPVGDVAAFIESARPLRPRLVVIDTMARCMVGGSDSSDRDVGDFVYAVDQIRECLDCAVLVVHHAGKNGEYRGSSALLGAADTFLKVKRIGKNRVVIVPEKVKDGDEDGERQMAPVQVENSLVLLPANMVISLRPLADDLDSQELDILRFANLSIFKNADFKVNEVVDGTSLSRASAYRKLDALKVKGFLRYDEQKKSYAITTSGMAAVKDIDEKIASRTIVVDGKRVEMPDMTAEGANTVLVNERPYVSEARVHRFEALRSRYIHERDVRMDDDYISNEQAVLFEETNEHAE